jgi:stage III sporulation protein AG
MNESNKKSYFVNLIEKLKAGKAIHFAIISLCVLILGMIVIYGINGSTVNNNSDNEIDVYVNNLEFRLEKVLSKVEGVGNVSVVITVNSGKETVLAMNKNTIETSNGIETEETPIIVNGETVTVKEKYPDIIGVLVVAEGADKISVMRRIQQATMSLLDVGLSQIEILTMKQ